MPQAIGDIFNTLGDLTPLQQERLCELAAQYSKAASTSQPSTLRGDWRHGSPLRMQGPSARSTHPRSEAGGRTRQSRDSGTGADDQVRDLACMGPSAAASSASKLAAESVVTAATVMIAVRLAEKYPDGAMVANKTGYGSPVKPTV